MERRQQVGFALKVLHDRFTHQRVWRGIDHFLDCHKFGHIREMHITGAVDRPHPAYAYYLLDCIAICKCQSRLKLPWKGENLDRPDHLTIQEISLFPVVHLLIY